MDQFDMRMVLFLMCLLIDTATPKIYTYVHTLTRHDALPIFIAIVIGICIEAALVASAAPWIERLHVLAQTPVYLVLGIIWILPLKPLLRWLETGSWKTPR